MRQLLHGTFEVATRCVAAMELHSFTSRGRVLVSTAVASLVMAQAAGAQVIAITGGTVYPVSGPKIDNGTVVITDGRITAVGANVAIPSGAARVDATGKWVTPGLVNAMTTLGLAEAGNPKFSGGYNDTQATVSDAISASFDVLDGINPASTLIRPTTQNGITTVGVFPGGNWFSGKGVVVDLAGSTAQQMLLKRGAGMYLQVDASAAGDGARGAMFGRLRDLFADARQYRLRRAQYEAGNTRAFAASRAQLEALQPVLAGTMPLVAVVDRASDIRTMIQLGRDFGLKLVIASGAEAWQVADEIASAKVPVMVGALNNIPVSFDALGQRQENAAILRAAGVEVSLIGNGPGDPESFNVRNLRQEAGNAVAYGLSWDEALRAVTLAPALALGVADKVGSLQVGREANIVVWDGDPFEFSSKAEKVYIRGTLQTGASRQDELVARYRSKPVNFAQPSTGSPPSGTPAASSRPGGSVGGNNSGGGAAGSGAVAGSWVLSSMRGTSKIVDGQGRAPTLTISDSRAAGFGGCNRYNGPVTIESGSRIRFGALATTMMACMDGGDQLERAYHDMLARVRNWSIQSGVLTLSGDAGVLATFRRQ